MQSQKQTIQANASMRENPRLSILSTHIMFSICALHALCTSLFAKLCKPFRNTTYHHCSHTTSYCPLPDSKFLPSSAAQSHSMLLLHLQRFLSLSHSPYLVKQSPLVRKWVPHTLLFFSCVHYLQVIVPPSRLQTSLPNEVFLQRVLLDLATHCPRDYLWLLPSLIWSSLQSQTPLTRFSPLNQSHNSIPSSSSNQKRLWSSTKKGRRLLPKQSSGISTPIPAFLVSKPFKSLVFYFTSTTIMVFYLKSASFL